MSKSPNRLLGLISGLVLLALGIVGLFTPAGALLLGLFQVNYLQCGIHIVIGAALVAASLVSVRAAQRCNAIVGAILLALGFVGFFTAGTEYNVLAVNAADNALHCGISAVLLAVGLGAERDGAR
jgi:hypothetical protein